MFHDWEARQSRFCHAIDDYSERFVGISKLWIAPDYFRQPVSAALPYHLLQLMPGNDAN